MWPSAAVLSWARGTVWPEGCNERWTGGEARGGDSEEGGERWWGLEGKADLGEARMHVRRGHTVCQERLNIILVI